MMCVCIQSSLVLSLSARTTATCLRTLSPPTSAPAYALNIVLPRAGIDSTTSPTCVLHIRLYITKSGFATMCIVSISTCWNLRKCAVVLPLSVKFASLDRSCHVSRHLLSSELESDPFLYTRIVRWLSQSQHLLSIGPFPSLRSSCQHVDRQGGEGRGCPNFLGSSCHLLRGRRDEAMVAWGSETQSVKLLNVTR